MNTCSKLLKLRLLPFDEFGVSDSADLTLFRVRLGKTFRRVNQRIFYVAVLGVCKLVAFLGRLPAPYKLALNRTAQYNHLIFIL